jgi:hypothetical protein
MAKTFITPQNSLLNEQHKDNSRATQLKTIFEYLQNHIATASMVTDATGVPQKNLTRYKRDLEKSNRLWELHKTYCKKTGFKAWYLSTNEKHKPNAGQLNLFTT